MYTINEFSKLSNTSVTTLRYYDEIDLFKPSYTDIFSGYRYYIEEQIYTISIINKLKEIDISLSDIKKYLKDHDLDILIKQREKYKDKLKKVEEIIKMKENSNYEVMESNYRKFIEVNGTKQIKCPMGIELRNNNARYFLINKNNEFYNDFVIYNNNNWLTLDKRFILDEKLMEHIFNYLKDEGYDYITIYVPIEDEKFIDYLKTNYDITLEKVKQSEYEYYHVKLLLK